LARSATSGSDHAGLQRGVARGARDVDEIQEVAEVPPPCLLAELQPLERVIPDKFVHLIAGTAVRVGEALDQGELAEPGQCSQVGTGDHFCRLAGKAADEDPQSLDHRAIGLAQPAPRTVQHSLDAAVALFDETGRIGPGESNPTILSPKTQTFSTRSIHAMRPTEGLSERLRYVFRVGWREGPKSCCLSRASTFMIRRCDC
jgi:hypothetical protein